MNWFTKFRIRQLRKAKQTRLERFQLAMKHGSLDLATEHRKALHGYIKKIERLTGEIETVTRVSE